MSGLCSMRTCCGCLDTAKGTVLTAIACVAACIVSFIFIVLGLIYWTPFSHAFHQHYNNTGISEDVVDLWLKVVWWGNIFTLIFMVVYVILCVLLIVGVKKEAFKHMIPWISLSTMLIPFVFFSFLFQLIMGIVGGGVMGVIVPAVVVLLWCVIWFYGFCCAVSHYRMLKGDIHRPVATLFKKPRDPYYNRGY